MSKFVKILLWLNLAAILVLAIVYPGLMISPGPVIKGHQEYATDCFACHTPLFGARSEKCISCHKVDDIGLLTTKGKPVVKSKPATAFHQKLLGQDCVACHSDHEGVIVFREVKKFSHALVDDKTLKQCVGCHKVPADRLHEATPKDCLMCHITDKWKPATFKHELLLKKQLNNCQSCHLQKTPRDKLHENASKDCKVCHSTNKWKPAIFKHEFLAKKQLNNCQSCHLQKTPKDKLHENASKDCKVCHSTKKWKPAIFKHELLAKKQLNNCQSCHLKKTPKDKLHENASKDCKVCHSTKKWKPATFKHELLPKSELRVCENCHIKKMPADRLHRESTKRCKNCHTINKWKPAKDIFGKSRSFSRTLNPAASPSLFDRVAPGWWRGDDDDDGDDD